MYAVDVAAPATHRASIRDRDPHRLRRRPESVLAPFWVFSIVLALLVITAALPTASGSSRVSSATRRVRIAATDTLWSVAAANPVGGLTTAESVAVIRNLNGLEDGVTLQPGAVITVPSGAGASPDLAMR
jgi:hypothetical protein